MATVLSNDMVAHVWANQSQPDARSNNGQFYFSGRALYSYGRHFVAGYVMPDGVTLLNAESYSITTSRHQSHARHAARGRTVTVPDLTDLAVYALPALETDKARARDGILRHVRDHALRYDDESALYVLGVVGRARSWGKIRRDAERKEAKRKADAKAADIASRKYEAERAATMTDSDFAEWQTRAESADKWGKFPTGRDWPRSEWRRARPSESLATMAAELHRLNVAARAHCGKRVQSALKARLAAVRARVRQLAKWESHGDALAAYSRNLADLRAMYRERMESGPLSRERNKALGRLAHAVLNARPGLLTDRARDALTAVIRNAQELEKQAAEREAAERMERERADREAWLAGAGSRYWRGSDAAGGALLRAVNVERDESGAIVAGDLQTSHGADVPLTHAVRAFRFLKLCRETGRAWESNGRTIRVGHFRVDRVEPSGDFRAGCHVIHWQEVERLARELGVFDAPADESALIPSHAAA